MGTIVNLWLNRQYGKEKKETEGCFFAKRQQGKNEFGMEKISKGIKEISLSEKTKKFGRILQI